MTFSSRGVDFELSEPLTRVGISRGIEQLLFEQRGVFAAWQAIERGVTSRAIGHATAQLTPLYENVWLSGHAPATDWQRWKGATLTTRATDLAHASAAALMGFRSDRGAPTIVVRAGTGGPTVTPSSPTRCFALTVFRRKDVTESVVIDGIDSVSRPRTVLDLVAAAPMHIADRIVRDVLRLKVVRPIELRDQVRVHKGERGVARLDRLVGQYGDLGLERTKSDAEVEVLIILTRAGCAFPLVNQFVAGHEADFIDPERKLILEVDGPSFHKFALRDAIKQAAWEVAGWVVRRVPSGDAYESTAAVVELASREVSDDERRIAVATRGPDDVLRRWRSTRST